MDSKASKEKPKRPWRETLEGITVAVVMAVFLKYFLVEAYKIPSGSMQPTLMGNPETGIFDRILVDKLSFHFREPKRYEVVVFKHPLNRALNMIKRIVGMPGESLRIHNGDLWTRQTADEPWQVLRRPESVQEGMWRELATEGAWRVREGTSGWRVEGDRVLASGPGAVVFPAPNVHVKNRYTDGYPPKVAAAIKSNPRQAGTRDVGDLRVSGAVEAGASCTALVVELQEGERRYRFALPGPAAGGSNGDGGDARPSIAVSGYEGAPGVVVAERGEPLRAGRTTRFAVQNLDDRLRFELDGEVVLELDVPPATNQRSRLALEVAGGGAELSDLRAFRDIYYVEEGLSQNAWMPIPAGHYVMLGDNTLDSADARDWRRARIRIREPQPDLAVGTILEGNARRSNQWGDANPYAANGHLFFRDVWGEVHALPLGTVQELPDQAGPTVPRELVTGRAVCVFWPVSLKYGVARFSWIN